jgi:hypothetical protein
MALAGDDRLSGVRNRKSLDVQRNNAAREYVRMMVASDFKGNVNAAAIELGVSQSTLSAFLNGDKGAGLTLLDAVANHKSVSLDVVLGRAPAPDPNDPYPCKRMVIMSREFQGASEDVQRAFLELESDEGDQSVVGWSRDFLGLMEADRLGRLRSRGGKRLLSNEPEHAEDRPIALLPPKT